MGFEPVGAESGRCRQGYGSVVGTQHASLHYLLEGGLLARDYVEVQFVVPTMASFMTSAAVPCTGALMALRSA